MLTLKALSAAGLLTFAVMGAAPGAAGTNNGHHYGQDPAHTNNGHHCHDHGDKAVKNNGKQHGQRRGHHHGHTHCPDD